MTPSPFCEKSIKDKFTINYSPAFSTEVKQLAGKPPLKSDLRTEPRGAKRNPLFKASELKNKEGLQAPQWDPEILRPWPPTAPE